MKKVDLKVVVMGLIAGVTSGLFGSGGGLILVPFLQNKKKMEVVKARGTTIFCILFMVITASLFYIKSNYFDCNLGIKCAVGGILGSYIGSKLLVKLDKKYLELSFIIFLIYAGIKMIKG